MKYKLRNNKKGFTLVELIVVLTILAVLAVMLIPALQGYIEKSLETADVLHVREAYMEVLTASLTNDTANQVKTVNLKQKQDDWQSMTLSRLRASRTIRRMEIPTTGRVSRLQAGYVLFPTMLRSALFSDGAEAVETIQRWK